MNKCSGKTNSSKKHFQIDFKCKLGLALLFTISLIVLFYVVSLQEDKCNFLYVITTLSITICIAILQMESKEKHINDFQCRLYYRLESFRKISESSDSFVNDFYDFRQRRNNNNDNRQRELYIKHDLHTFYLRLKEVFKCIDTYEYSQNEVYTYYDLIKAEFTKADLYKLFFLYNYKKEEDETFVKTIYENKLLDNLSFYFPQFNSIYKITWQDLPNSK